MLPQALPSPPLPPDRLSDSKSETLIQRSAQVSWILLKSHFHLTSALLASPPPPPKKTPAININPPPPLLPSPSTHCSSEISRSSSLLSAGHCFPAPPIFPRHCTPGRSNILTAPQRPRVPLICLISAGGELAERITQVSHQNHQ